MRIVDNAVEDGVGEGGIADYIVPAVYWELTGDQCCAVTVTFFGDLEEVMALLRAEWFKAPVVEDEELDATKRAHQARITSVTMGQRQIDEEARDALVEDGPVVAARLVAEGTSKPRFAHTGRAHEILPKNSHSTF